MSGKGPSQLIGMLHVPVSNILMCRDSLLSRMRLPAPTTTDHSIWNAMSQVVAATRTESALPSFGDAFGSAECLSVGSALVDLASRLSFMSYLEDRVLGEIEVYLRHGIGVCQLENVGAPYSSPPDIPVIEGAVLDALCTAIRQAHRSLPMGIQVLAFADNIALGLAVKHRLFYVRGESLVFPGMRPDALCTGTGNLKKAYIMRGILNRESGRPNEFPRIFVDLMKKHTVFVPELHDLSVWLENVEFMKLEGIILSGAATGVEIAGDDMARAREFLDSVAVDGRAQCGYVPLLAGSGTTPENVGGYKRSFDAMIVGSSVKRDGYWENELDESRVARLAEAFRMTP